MRRQIYIRTLFFGFDPDAASVAMHNVSGDGQAEPGAALAGGALDVGPTEGLNQLDLFGFRDARPLIANRNPRAAVLGRRAHFDRGPNLRELDGVGDQIVQHLLDLSFIERQYR